MRRQKPNRRDIGLNTGAGKGDAPRYKHDENYIRNFEAIDFKQANADDGFVRVHEGKLTKRYGTLREPAKSTAKGLYEPEQNQTAQSAQSSAE